MTRAETLQAFVASVEGKPVAWRTDDCCAWPAEWVRTLTGRSVALPFYDSEEGAHALVDSVGGLDVLWTRLLAPLEIYATPFEPVLGDIGVVKTARYGDVGVIFAEDGIALWRASNGVALVRPRRSTMVKVWRMPE